MKEQLHIFFNALSFFTRIPCPKWVNFSKEKSKKSIAYFSLIGIIVGGIGAGVFYFSNYILPTTISVILSIVATIYTTGAFHEDGFADVCDGLGGGWTKEKILQIMKDSSIGAYGAIGVFLLLLLKVFCLVEMPPLFIPVAIISGHSVSRLMASVLVYNLDYVSSSSTSKSQVQASGMTFSMLLLNIVFGVLPVLLLPDYLFLLALIPCLFSVWFLGSKFKKWIGGQTGDCAGATQQFCEVIYYMSLLVLWKFI